MHADREGFDRFYAANFSDTVAMAYGLTADLGESEDIAQEAFCRAFQRWHRLSTYDNPATWVKRVAANLACSRWRRLRVAAAHRLRQRPEVVAPAAEPEHVMVVAALRKLPVEQREAIVLHHMADLPVGEVARRLDVPEGTVKSWLHRGRMVLARELEAPDPGVVARRARARKRVRNVVTAVAVLLLLLWVAAAVQRFVPAPPPVIQPSPSPSATVGVAQVSLRDEGDRVVLTWVDPSNGAAQPIIVGMREGETPRRMGVPQMGAVELVVSGLSQAYDYCFSVVLAYSDTVFTESPMVCTHRTNRPSVGPT